jgi:hypothetical protein
VEGLLELIPMKGKQVLMKLFLNQWHFFANTNSHG